MFQQPMSTLRHGVPSRSVARIAEATRSALLLATVLAVAAPARADSQGASRAAGHLIHRSVPPTAAKTHTVVLGERFQAGSVTRWLLGSDYRDLWTTPIEVAVLDLDNVGEGLTPLRTGGFGQSISLHFTGNNGRRYTVRSIDKDPTKRIRDELKNTLVEDVLQDQISALLPTGALIADPLMEAAGILHSTHSLVVIPDDPRLGEFRQEFAGLIGTLQEHPSEGPEGRPGFAGSAKISGTEKLWKKLEATPSDRVDSRAYLNARLMDFLINDKDRHPGQWRWARFPDESGAGHIWVPIPEDRDQAFINLDGFAMAVARRAIPRQIKFEDSFPNLEGLSTTGWELDREFLAELDKSDWDSVVREFQASLPDRVIEDAVRRLPAPFFDMIGESLTLALKSRRDRLPKYAASYYRMITRAVDISATDRDEVVELEHMANGDLAVRIAVTTGPSGHENAPYFQRTLHGGETKEVRLYARGGDDRVRVLGENAKIRIRADGGGGDDTFVNLSTAGAGKTEFYDHRGQNRFETGRGATVNQRPYKRPAGSEALNVRYALNWGKRVTNVPILSASPDLGVSVGATSSRVYFGYRRDPFSSRHSIRLGLASRGVKPFAAYEGLFRHVWPDVDGTLRVEFSGIDVIRFNGLGNETETPESSSFYKVERRTLVFAPGLAVHAGANRGGKPGSEGDLRPTLSATAGPTIRFSDTPAGDNDDKFIGSMIPSLYGTDSFGQVGAQVGLAFDTRDNPAFATSGFLVKADGVLYPEIWDVESTFGRAGGSVATYLTANKIITAPTLALRIGGEKAWGTFPFHEAAYLGGPGNLRGFRQDRFGGDGSAFGNAELRLTVSDLKILVPGEFGLFGVADVGRVFFDEDPDGADDWHEGFGGGVWMSFLQREQTLSIGVVSGDDLTGAYARTGFMF